LVNKVKAGLGPVLQMAHTPTTEWGIIAGLERRGLKKLEMSLTMTQAYWPMLERMDIGS
jgi:hypothetical protein